MRQDITLRLTVPAVGLFCSILAAACGGRSPTTGEVDPALSAEWVRAGSFRQDGTRCVFTSPDGVARGFVCREILVGLRAGSAAADVRDLLAAISGEVVHEVDPGGPYSRITVRVPAGSEQAALLRAGADSRVRYVNLNWTDASVR